MFKWILITVAIYGTAGYFLANSYAKPALSSQIDLKSLNAKQLQYTQQTQPGTCDTTNGSCTNNSSSSSSNFIYVGGGGSSWGSGSSSGK